MPRYAALLRGVNVGRGPRVPMAAFRALLTGLGFSEVATLLNSGNAVFSAPRTGPGALGGRIRAALLKELGTSVPVIVVTGDALSKAAAGNPFVSANPSRLLVVFAQDGATLRRLAPSMRTVLRAPDDFSVGPAAAYLHCPGGIAHSKAADALLGRLGHGITTRNLATTRKLAQLAITTTGDATDRASAGGEPRRKKRGSQGDETPSRLIDARIKELGDWRGAMLSRLRTLIAQADPGVVEEWKWGGVPVWSHHGLICTGETYTHVVKMTFAKGAALKDPAGLFNASLEGTTRRAIDFREGQRIDEAALKALVRAAVALNTPGTRRDMNG